MGSKVKTPPQCVWGLKVTMGSKVRGHSSLWGVVVSVTVGSEVRAHTLMANAWTVNVTVRRSKVKAHVCMCVRSR